MKVQEKSTAPLSRGSPIRDPNLDNYPYGILHKPLNPRPFCIQAYCDCRVPPEEKPVCNWPAATPPGRTLDHNHLVKKNPKPLNPKTLPYPYGILNKPLNPKNPKPQNPTHMASLTNFKTPKTLNPTHMTSLTNP